MALVLALSAIGVNDILPIGRQLMGRLLEDRTALCRCVLSNELPPEVLMTNVKIDEIGDKLETVAAEVVAAYSKHNDSMLGM